MALAYPEGEAFFLRSALDSSSADGYHASDVKQFYSHMMVEFIWNRWSNHGSREANSPKGYTHPRSGYKIVNGSWWDTDYGAWTQLPFNYGPHFKDIKRRVQHNLCTNGNRFRDLEKGGSNESWFMFMPMPTTEERWVWIDLLSYIRAIYFPVSYAVSKDHQDLCSFVQVNFSLDRQVNFWRGGSSYGPKPTDKLLGLNINRESTVGLDVTGLIQLLTPAWILAADVNTVPVTQSVSDSLDKPWTAVAGGNFGLDLTWRPPEKTTWIENFIRNTLTIAIGFVPVAGPFLQVAFSVGWTLLSTEDPQEAFELLKNLCPGIDLAENIAKEIIKSSNETKKFLPEGWQSLNLSTQKKAVDEQPGGNKPIEDMDKGLPMLMQREVLNSTGNNPGGEKKGADDQGDGEKVADNPVSAVVQDGEGIAGTVANQL